MFMQKEDFIILGGLSALVILVSVVVHFALSLR